MQEFELELSDDEFESVNTLETGPVAVEICKIYFRRQNQNVEFPPSPNGADLHVKFPDQTGFDIEVKGTTSANIAWQKIKVSSQHSYDMIRAGMPIYRVSNIGARNLMFFIMKYGEDFEMTPEPRWRVHKPNR